MLLVENALDKFTLKVSKFYAPISHLYLTVISSLYEAGMNP